MAIATLTNGKPLLLDGDNIKPDTFYTLNNGEFIEVVIMTKEQVEGVYDGLKLAQIVELLKNRGWSLERVVRTAKMFYEMENK